MCAPSQGAMLPYGLKIPSPYFPFGPSGGLTQAHLSALDFQRSQLNDYNVRVQLGLRNYQTSLGLSPFHAYITDPYTQAYFYKHDPRARFVQEEPKPSHSYIGLIGMAILNSKEKKLVLSDIYQWILDNYPYFRTRGPGWRNSIRHNLSLNDCFIKAGRSANGKGHYWAVHPANVEDFERGDFRRRRAQRKVRRHMGLSVPDDDDSPTPSPTQPWPHHDINQDSERAHLDPLAAPGDHAVRSLPTGPDSNHLVLSHPTPTYGPLQVQPRKPSKKRLFDMASLLAPDDDEEERDNSDCHPHNDMMQSQQMHVSGFSFHPIHDIKAHDMKGKSSSESMADSNGSNSTQELTVDVNSTSSGSGKEMSCDSDYDGDNDNDEIQVTSGENSPALGMSEPCDTVSEQAINGRYDNRNGKNRCVDEHNAMQMLGQDPSKMSSSPYFSESKVENALDLSSSNASEGEKKLNAPVNNGDDSKNNVMVRENGDSHQKGMNGNNLSIQEPDRENCNRQDNPKTYNERNASGEVISDCGRERNFENDQKSKFRNRNFIQTGRDIKTETPTQLSNNGREHSKFCTEKLHYFRSEKKDINRPQSQHRSESNFSGGDSNMTDAEQCNQMDMRTITSSGHSSPVSETEHIMRWADMSKASSLPRDRMSAFSTLSGRNHSMYSPFQLRNYGVAQHRFLPTSSPLRTGVPAPLLTVTSSSPGPVSSVAVMKGMDISSSKCSSISGNTNHSSNNNSTSSMGTGGHIRD